MTTKTVLLKGTQQDGFIAALLHVYGQLLHGL